MNWIVYSLLANAIFVGLEYTYRAKTFDTYWQSLPIMFPMMISANYMLFHLYRSSPSFLMGWAVLSFGNAVCRMATNWFLGEPMSWVILWGIVTMLSGMFIIKLGS